MNLRLDDPLLRRGGAVCVSILAVYLLVTYVLAYLTPFVAAYAAALMLDRPVGFLQRRCGLRRGLAALLGLVTLGVAVGGVGAAVVNNVRREAVQFIAHIPDFLEHVTGMVEGFLGESAVMGNVYGRGQGGFSAANFGLVEGITEFVQNTIGDGVATTSWALFKTLPGFVIWVMLFAISCFFFIKDKQLISAAVARNTPKGLHRWCAGQQRGMIGVLGGYVRAQLIIMTVIALISVGALMFRGYEYALLMGVMIAFVDALPLVGSALILLPWAAVSLVQGQITAGLYLLALWGVNFLVRQLMEPKVLSASIGLHPILMLVSMYGGLRLLGPVGLLVGPMWMMSVKISYSHST